MGKAASGAGQSVCTLELLRSHPMCPLPALPLILLMPTASCGPLLLAALSSHPAQLLSLPESISRPCRQGGHPRRQPELVIRSPPLWLCRHWRRQNKVCRAQGGAPARQASQEDKEGGGGRWAARHLGGRAGACWRQLQPGQQAGQTLCAGRQAGRQAGAAAAC